MDDAKMKEKMEEVKTKAKAFMKNFSSPFGSARGNSSTQTFRGQGHRLGGSAVPSSSAPTPRPGDGCGSASNGCRFRPSGPGFHEQKLQQNDFRKLQQEKWERERGLPPAQTSCHLRESNSPHAHSTGAHVIQSGGAVSSAAASVKSPTPDDRLRLEMESRGTVQVGNLDPAYSSWKGSEHFDPYAPIIASGTSHRPSVAANRVAEPQGKFQCPICQTWWQSEVQVSAHIDECTGVGQSEFARLSIGQERNSGRNHYRESSQEGHVAEDLDASVAIFFSGGPSNATIDVILKVFRNILSDPTEVKYRKLRLGNEKIKDTIGSAIGGLKVLESVGFRSVNERQEKYSLMDQPTIEQQERIQAAIAYLDSYQSAKAASVASSLPSHPVTNTSGSCNRQLRIFYAPRGHIDEQFEVPDSFYNLSAAEVKNEAAARRKKLEDSSLLIPKSFKEKLAANARRRYPVTVVRIRLPDGLAVQGCFKPGEPTTSLYEFVASILKDSHETFDLVLPAPTRHQVIPRFPDASGHCLTLEEADLVPKALLKFTPTGPQGYTCLKSECYELCEPLTLTSSKN